MSPPTAPHPPETAQEPAWATVDDGLVRRIRERVAHGLASQHSEREGRGLARLDRHDEEELALSLVNDQLRLHARTG